MAQVGEPDVVAAGIEQVREPSACAAPHAQPGGVAAECPVDAQRRGSSGGFAQAVQGEMHAVRRDDAARRHA
ncbi:MAG: hypothetical protein DMD29_01715 [Gemmatimonadetes bacterium]|nr:MAG: hypothetical protein DMD29_01715 [Gemmatimonadota bacterium]